MLDTKHLKDISFLNKDYILKLDQFLSARGGKIRISGEIINIKVSVKTTFMEIARACKVPALIYEAIRERKKVAPVWEVALKKMDS